MSCAGMGGSRPLGAAVERAMSRPTRRGYAMAESFFGTLGCDLLDRTKGRTQADAKIAVFDRIEGWYNPEGEKIPP